MLPCPASGALHAAARVGQLADELGLAWLGDPLSVDYLLEGCLHHRGVAAINVLEIARGKVDARGDPLFDELADLLGSVFGLGCRFGYGF